jgi:hypothetical protein
MSLLLGEESGLKDFPSLLRIDSFFDLLSLLKIKYKNSF